MRVIILLTLLISSQLSFSAEYLCSADAGTGFGIKNGKWQQQNIDAANFKYLIRSLKPSELTNDSNTHGAFRLGESFPLHRCKLNSENEYVCLSPTGSSLNFSITTLRFVAAYTGGYWQKKYYTDTPMILIGKCTSI